MSYERAAGAAVPPPALLGCGFAKPSRLRFRLPSIDDKVEGSMTKSPDEYNLKNLLSWMSAADRRSYHRDRTSGFRGRHGGHGTSPTFSLASTWTCRVALVVSMAHSKPCLGCLGSIPSWRGSVTRHAMGAMGTMGTRGTMGKTRGRGTMQSHLGTQR